MSDSGMRCDLGVSYWCQAQLRMELGKAQTEIKRLRKALRGRELGLSETRVGGKRERGMVDQVGIDQCELPGLERSHIAALYTLDDLRELWLNAYMEDGTIDGGLSLREVKLVETAADALEKLKTGKEEVDERKRN